MVDEDLLEEAKARKIPIGKTLEDALKNRLDKDLVIEDLKEQRKKYLKRSKDLKKEIDRLESERAKTNKSLGTKDVRMEKALKVAQTVVDNEGSISNERLSFIAEKNNVKCSELREQINVKK